MKEHKQYIETIFESVENTKKLISEEEKVEEIKPYSSEMFDELDKEIAEQDKFINENKALYKIFNSVDNVIASENQFQRIQNVDSKVDVNNKKVYVTATTKTDDQVKDTEILEMFLEKFKEYNKECGKFTYESKTEEMNFGENAMGGSGKLIMTITVS